jgi:DNA-binding NtrC family response regulator
MLRTGVHLNPVPLLIMIAQVETQPKHALVVLPTNSEICREIVDSLANQNCSSTESGGGAEAISQFENACFDLLILDRWLPDLDSTEVLRVIREQRPDVAHVLLDSRTGEIIEHHQCTELQPILLHSMQAVQRTNPSMAFEACPAGEVRRPTTASEPLPGVVGTGKASEEISSLVRLVARRSTTVLIHGESGTGKELIARAIHQLSPRSASPLVVVNCAAIPESLLESELFGHVRGAFTGATQSRVGRIHAAHRGSLLLDEVSELSLAMQAKLLRFLQEGEVQRLGSEDVIRVDVRVIAATNVDLEQRCELGQFRHDLYYRLAVFPLHIPALRERREDIIPLAEHFLRQLSRENGMLPAKLDGEVYPYLLEHPWPGNVRQLRHYVERAFILADGDGVLRIGHFRPGNIEKNLRQKLPQLA